jgi:hypothetical protein
MSFPLCVEEFVKIQGVQITMWVYMFESDKACGPNLWGFGIFLIVLAFLQGIIYLFVCMHICLIAVFHDDKPRRV